MIEWSRVNDLREEVGAEDFDEVVGLFLEEVDDLIQKLESESDRSALEQDLHFLKGSALSLGFATLSQQCQTGESASAQGRAAEVDLAGIIACYHRSRHAFLDGLGGSAHG